nr:MAG: hypothetical protein [Bacteriophage sp.]
MSTKMVLVGPDYIEVEAVESVTPRMAALAAMPFGPDNYGKKKVPTSWVITYMGRGRRVYCDAIGNAGTCYVLVKGEKHFVR